LSDSSVPFTIIFQGSASKYSRREYTEKMNTVKISKSRKTFLRREKSRIRRSVADLKEQEKMIEALYPKI